MGDFVDGVIDWLRGSPEAMRRESERRSEENAREIVTRLMGGDVDGKKLTVTSAELEQTLQGVDESFARLKEALSGRAEEEADLR